MGGALPALLGVGGVTGVASLSRQSRWSVAMRVGACAGITLACWTGLALLIGVTAGGRAAGQGTAISAATGRNKVKLTPNEELLHKIAVTYYQHGHITSEMEKMKGLLADTCDTLSEEACSKYLKQELAKVKSSPYEN
jgi:3-oxoacyl-ACP reductase-like protein